MLSILKGVKLLIISIIFCLLLRILSSRYNLVRKYAATRPIDVTHTKRISNPNLSAINAPIYALTAVAIPTQKSSKDHPKPTVLLSINLVKRILHYVTVREPAIPFIKSII